MTALPRLRAIALIVSLSFAAGTAYAVDDLAARHTA